MPLDRYTNTDQVNSKSPTFGQTWSADDLAAISNGIVELELQPQDLTGTGVRGLTIPTMEYHVYSGDQIQYSNIGNQIKTNVPANGTSPAILVQPEKDIRYAGFQSGTYSIVYNHVHQVARGRITEISADKKEIRIASVTPNAFLGLRNVYNGKNIGNPSNSFEGRDNHTPFILNLGNNKINNVLDMAFFGTLNPVTVATLPYPNDGAGLVWIPTSTTLDGNGGVGKWATFMEVDTTRPFNTVYPGSATAYPVTQNFDRYKLTRNSNTTLSWIKKDDEPFLTSGSLPPDVPQDTARLVETGGTVVINTDNLSLTYNTQADGLQSVDEAILKLYTEVDSSVKINDVVDVQLELIKPYVEKLIVFNALETIGSANDFSEPNFNYELASSNNGSGEFESWNSLLDAGYPTSQQVIDKFFSGSLGNIKLNTDHSDFSNFVNFSSAAERVKNFRYKLQQIERFDSRISTLNNVSGSEALTNISQSQNRRDALIGGFDDFEYWLYYSNQASLYTHHSSSEFIVEPYPKASTNPNELYGSTTSQGKLWYNKTYKIAEDYDAVNAGRLRNLIPVNIQDDEKNSEYITFINMLGQHFDIVWTYIEALTTVNLREEHPKDGLPNQLVDVVAEGFGWKLFNGYSDAALWNYELGVNKTGTNDGINSGSLETKPTKEIVQETWRRLLNNLPGIYKSKGTARSFKSLISSYGIPSSFLKIREYGGPKIADTKNVYEHDRFVYKLKLSGGQPAIHPWDTIQSKRPGAIEIIGKMPQGNHTVFRLHQWDGATSDLRWHYNSQLATGHFSVTNGSSAFMTTPTVPYKKQRDIAVTVNSGSGGYSLYSAWVDDWGDILANPTASTTSHDINIIWNSTQQSSSLNRLESPFNNGINTTSSIQEVRYYSEPLSNEIIQEHAKNREAYFSDDNTTDLDLDTSFEKVLYRIFPDSTFNTISGSIISRHPNQKISTSDYGHFLSASYANGSPSQLVGEVDTMYVTIPSVGALNLTNNKVRIESGSLKGPLLFDKSNEVSQYDFAPNDSNLLGTYFSTTDTVNFDIYASEGYFEIDDLVGDTDVRNNDGYDILDFRARNYFQKYTGRTGIQLIIDMLSRYDMSIFDSMKQIVPARADWHKGILIEPHVFERNNYKRPDTISHTDHQYKANPIPVVQSISGSFLHLSSSIDMDNFTSAVYKFEKIQRLNITTGQYFDDTNPYWEYSPTGSHITNARMSSHYLEPKYFYSNSVSASLGIEFANSASFHFARVQDTRLAGNIENLLYNGCKISSDSLTTDSLDTPDGGPVIEITKVEPTVLVYNTPSDNGSVGSGAGSGTKPIKPVKLVPVEDLVAYIKEVDKEDAVDSAQDVESSFQVSKPLPIPRVKGIRGGKAASNPKIIPNQTRISTDIVQRGLRGRRNRNARNLGF